MNVTEKQVSFIRSLLDNSVAEGIGSICKERTFF